MITKFNKIHRTDKGEGFAFLLTANGEVPISLVENSHIDSSYPLLIDINKWVEVYCIIHDISWKDFTITSDMISVEPINENSAKILKVNLVEYKGIEAGLVGRGYVLDKNEVISVSDIGKYINFPEMEIVLRSYRVLSEEETEKYGLQ